MVESRRLLQTKDAAYAYLVREVDPVIANCITHLLITRPSNHVPQAMLEFLKGDCNTDFNTGIMAKRDQRMYLATKISPILSKIMTKLATVQPTNVVEYICGELQTMINNNEEYEVDPKAIMDKVDNLPRPVKDKRPYSSRGMLGEAVAYDRSRMTTSDIERPGTAPQSDRKACVVQQDVNASENIDIKQDAAPLRTIQIGLFGIGSAGKTSIINNLQGNFEGNVKPTLGFRPTTMMLGESTAIKFYDLGGGKKIRDIWDQYYHDIHAIIYVVDASLDPQSDPWKETKDVFEQTTNHLVIHGKPLLIVGNKIDIDGAMDINAVCDNLNVKTNRHCNVINCSTKASPEVSDQIAVDKNLELGLEWLLTTVNNSFDTLNNRVVSDTKNKTAQEVKKRLERERKVLKNKIASAFYNSLTEDLKPSGVEQASTEEIYDPEEGVKFLADEIGVTVDTIDKEAIVIANLVGYQRLALQIIGALFSPINKKKIPMSWPEIKEMVVELRADLGL